MSDNWIVQNLENALETWNEKLSEIWQDVYKRQTKTLLLSPMWFTFSFIPVMSAPSENI